MVKWLQNGSDGVDKLSKMVIDEVDGAHIFSHTY